MIFYIYNNFEWDEEADDFIKKSKYEECIKVKGIRIDRRFCDEPVKIKEWYEEGKNHRVVNGHIERDFDDEFYIIEMNTLEDLMNFQSKYNINASVSNDKSSHVYNGEELNCFREDYYME
jgi:hypothetical protein